MLWWSLIGRRGRNPAQKLRLLFAAAGKNPGLPKGIVSLVKVAHGDDGLGALPKSCNEVGCVILEERNSRAVVEDKGDCSVVLAWLARA
jgi:hypothetical protein